MSAEDDLLRDLRFCSTVAASLRGANTYRYVMRRIWSAYPLYLLSVTPRCGTSSTRPMARLPTIATVFRGRVSFLHARVRPMRSLKNNL